MDMHTAARHSRFGQAGVQTKYEFYLFDSESRVMYRKKNGKPIKPYWGNKFRYAEVWRIIAPYGEEDSTESKESRD